MRDRRLAAAALAALLAIGAYANSLPNGLVHDDVNVIERNGAVRDPTALRTIFLTPSWKARGDPTTISYRPLSTWTLAVDYALHGAAPFGYHVGNVVGHAVVSGLLALLAEATGLSVAAAGLAGCLFAVHPVHTEVVANGVGRAEVLAAALALLALLLGRRAAGGGWRVVDSAAAAAVYGLALLAKEHTIALLLVMPLADLLLSDGGSPRAFFGALRGRRAAFYGALAAVTGAYLVLRAAALGGVIGAGGSGFDAIVFWANPAASAPATVRVLTALHVLVLAVRLLVWPHPLSADYSYRQIPLVDGLATPAAAAGIGLVAALAVLAAWLWRRRPVACFWLILALATYGVVSNVPFPIGTIFGERLLYLPSAGFCVLVAAVLSSARGAAGRAGAFVVALALLAAWAAGTIARNPIWHDELTLALDMVRTAPASVHSHHLLGTTYAGQGRDGEALSELERALEIYPEHTTSLYNVGLIHQRHGRRDEALTAYRKVVGIDATFVPAWVSISAVHYGAGRYEPALDAAEHAVALASDLPAAHLARGNALRGLGRHAEARDAYAAALRGDPSLREALFGVAASALDLEDFALAADSFRQLVGVLPSVEVYRAYIYSAARADRADEARQALAAARARYPNEPVFAATGDGR